MNNPEKISKLELCEGKYIFACPWCQGTITVEQCHVACGIFRHAVYKMNLEPINPHSPKEECERLLSSNQIYGCAKPFEIIRNHTGEWAIECEYK